MATALQMAANRRNAKRSTGPRTAEGKQAVRLNAVKHGMTAKVIVLGQESDADYQEIRAALIHDYAPATSQELMLVDQIAAGYWRTIRARRFETEIFDGQIRALKHKHGKSTAVRPDTDDQGCAVFLQVEPAETLKNYFRYDGTISRDYYRAIAALEKMQAARRREEDRQERKAAEAKQLSQSASFRRPASPPAAFTAMSTAAGPRPQAAGSPHSRPAPGEPSDPLLH
jgi:hypothetical protein